ncbi:hypothetical protein POM88_040856 [Heracleum sosnowskyi]|uniref:Uncharacterized protein n=1 Tax=Heracleum sosnowskyi TaxID=360622 RepID=A0AAD8M7R1_9APIA|nr:hypothetical protein POM88_040856 [Heracleum sosnowskyi]
MMLSLVERMQKGSELMKARMVSQVKYLHDSSVMVEKSASDFFLIRGSRLSCSDLNLWCYRPQSSNRPTTAGSLFNAIISSQYMAFRWKAAGLVIDASEKFKGLSLISTLMFMRVLNDSCLVKDRRGLYNHLLFQELYQELNTLDKMEE